MEYPDKRKEEIISNFNQIFLPPSFNFLLPFNKLDPHPVSNGLIWRSIVIEPFTS